MLLRKWPQHIPQVEAQKESPTLWVGRFCGTRGGIAQGLLETVFLHRSLPEATCLEYSGDVSMTRLGLLGSGQLGHWPPGPVCPLPW